MGIVMTSIRRAPNGDWFARKVIPEDVREAYSKAFGAGREERFRRPADTTETKAKAEFRDWDATICSRIDALRAATTGTAIGLTHRQIYALTADWYGWFVAQHEEEPGTAEAWDERVERLEAAYLRFKYENEDDEAAPHPNVRRWVRGVVTELAKLPTFLAERNLTLDQGTQAAFLDAVEGELRPAFALLRRRAVGDYGADPRAARFAPSPASVVVVTASPTKAAPVKLAGLGCFELFRAWVNERKPAPATVDRWRGVFLELEERFKKRDVATITADEAVEWKDTLLVPGRSPGVVNDTWLRAAKTVFGWALRNRKVSENPFKDVSVSVPSKPVQVREREFTDVEAALILRSTLIPVEGRMAEHNASARRWVPWLCAYTGSRVGEVTQLRAEDVSKAPGGYWVMKITPDAGTVKTGQLRVVPLHEHLIEQGFMDFVRKVGKGPLFYDPSSKRKVSDDPTKPVQPLWVKARVKLSDWVREIGVKDRAISPNHAWRHTFKRKAARAGLERRIRFAFCGHESTDVGDLYETPTLDDLAEALKAFPRYDTTVMPKEEAE